MDATISPGVSIIICCYNSAARLPETLKHLALQQVPSHINWEIIVVNNASTDDTVDVAHLEWQKYNLPDLNYRVVDQPLPGLSNAREKGVEASTYEYLIFCDDDNWLDENYVFESFISLEDNYSAGVVGGNGTPLCEIPPPDWFNEYKEYYATGPQAELINNYTITDITTKKRYVYGAGAVFRKKALENLKNINFKNLLSDRIGCKLISGGDNELSYTLIIMGYKVLYNPKLQFKHFIPKERLSWAYFLKLNEGYGYSNILLLPYSNYFNNIQSSQIKNTWIWLLASSIHLFITVDFIRLLFKYKQMDLNFQISLSTRKGNIKSIWSNRNNISKNFMMVNNLISCNV